MQTLKSSYDDKLGDQLRAINSTLSEYGSSEESPWFPQALAAINARNFTAGAIGTW